MLRAVLWLKEKCCSSIVVHMIGSHKGTIKSRGVAGVVQECDVL